MSDTPAEVEQTPAQPPAQPQSVALPDALVKALARSGISPDQVRVYDLPEYVEVDLELLCSKPTARKNCDGESPIMVVERVAMFPDAEDFKGYVGYFRAECSTADGDHVAFTHYLRSKDTGQMGPLAEFVSDAVVPFALRVAMMGTRKGFHVFRPIPVVASQEASAD